MLCAFKVAEAEVFILTELTQYFALLGSEFLRQDLFHSHL